MAKKSAVARENKRRKLVEANYKKEVSFAKLQKA